MLFLATSEHVTTFFSTLKKMKKVDKVCVSDDVASIKIRQQSLVYGAHRERGRGRGGAAVQADPGLKEHHHPVFKV